MNRSLDLIIDRFDKGANGNEFLLFRGSFQRGVAELDGSVVCKRIFFFGLLAQLLLKQNRLTSKNIHQY